jgi:hypothetical protein
MTFTNAEVVFLSKGHKQGRSHVMAEIDPGMRASCPKSIMQRILESRAKKLGVEFRAFQEEQRLLANPNAPYVPTQPTSSVEPSLADRVAAAKLF